MPTSRSTPSRRCEVRPRSPPRSARDRSPALVGGWPGFIDIAVGSMAGAIKKISVARGYDVTRYTLQCFGGAGGATRLPDRRRAGHEPGLRPSAGGRAVGLRHGPADQTAPRGDDRATARVGAAGGRRAARGLADEARAELPQAPAVAAAEALRFYERVHVRYEGTDSALVVPFGDAAAIQTFEAAYRQRFAFLMPGAPGRRGGVGGGGRRGRRAGARPGGRPSTPAAAPTARTVRGLSGGAAGRRLVARGGVAPGHRRWPGDHRREERDHRRRARLAGASPRDHLVLRTRAGARGAARAVGTRSTR